MGESQLGSEQCGPVSVQGHGRSIRSRLSNTSRVGEILLALVRVLIDLLFGIPNRTQDGYVDKDANAKQPHCH